MSSRDRGMKVLFLDIDGVLNSIEWQESQRYDDGSDRDTRIVMSSDDR